jgi:hypothetical protein
MHVCVWVVGVAGWNTFPLLDWFGTLLGPEGTPVVWVFFLAAPGLGCLTHSCGVCGGVVVVVGLGCGCVLSVA